MERYFAERNGLRRWIHYLDNLTEEYNSTVHNSIDRAPNDVTRSNAPELFDYLEQKRRNETKRKRKTPFHIGDLVRLPLKALRPQKKFKKGAKAKWTKELYKIVKIHYGTFVPTFTVVGQHGEKQMRRFYENELNFVINVSDMKNKTTV